MNKCMIVGFCNAFGVKGYKECPFSKLQKNMICKFKNRENECLSEDAIKNAILVSVQAKEANTTLKTN